MVDMALPDSGKRFDRCALLEQISALFSPTLAWENEPAALIIDGISV
jgi:hypothetical protein